MKAVVLSSGGLDSTTCLGIAVDKYGAENVSVIQIFYGQRHSKELKSAKAVADYYGVKSYEFDVSNVLKYSDSSLLSNSTKSIEQSTYSEQKKVTNRIDTYVPFRNGLMLSVAASFADSIYIDDEVEIYIGVHKDDVAVTAYPDCSLEFIKAMDSVISIGTQGRIHLIAPFVNSNKAEVVKTGLKLKVPYQLTWSCYSGGEKPCRKCATCIDRERAFELNGEIDPLIKEND